MWTICRGFEPSLLSIFSLIYSYKIPIYGSRVLSPLRGSGRGGIREVLAAVVTSYGGGRIAIVE